VLQVCIVSRSEASSHRGSLDYSRFWRREVKWVTNWSWRRSCLTCMMYSTYLNWRNVCVAWRANPHGRFGCQGRSFLPRVPCKDFGGIREGYLKQEDQDVQGAMESPHWGRSYMGKRRKIEGGVSKFLFWSIRISRMRFILWGVGLSRPNFHRELNSRKNQVCK
jgi:hypothetical protein